MEIFLMRMRGMKKNKPVREVVLMVEDCYGGEFFKRLINELNESEFLNYKIKTLLMCTFCQFKIH